MLKEQFWSVEEVPTISGPRKKVSQKRKHVSKDIADKEKGAFYQKGKERVASREAYGKARKAKKGDHRAIACDKSSSSGDIVISCSSEFDSSEDEVMESKRMKKREVRQK